MLHPGTTDAAPGGRSLCKALIPPEDAQLWFAGKKMLPEKKLADYLGKNEKTKAVIKLGPRTGGAPPREPQLSPAQQQAMMSSWHQRREEQRRLEADDDDSFLSSAWADG